MWFFNMKVNAYSGSIIDKLNTVTRTGCILELNSSFISKVILKVVFRFPFISTTICAEISF